MADHTSSLRVRVELDGTEPPLWRRLELTSDMPLSELHEALQVAFGWTDSHLHRFTSSPDVYDPATVKYLMPFEIDEGEPGVPEGTVSLGELLVDPGDRLTYTYDFGDDWTHTLELEAVLPRSDSAPRSVCTAGDRPGPPEDCGGVDGYEAWCAAAEPSHPDHVKALARFRDITGTDVAAADFAMSPFDIDDVNRMLSAPGGRDLPSALADLLHDVIDARAAAWLEKTIAAIPRPGAPDAEAAARAVRPFTWLLDRVGADGITLTGAGYLPPAHVKAVAEELGITETGIGKFNREVQTFPVLAFREAAQQAKLLRKHRGKLVLTPAGRKLRTDPVGLWRHLATRFPVGLADECEHQAGLLLLIGIAAGWDDLGSGIARGLNAAGWVDYDRPLTPSAALGAAAGTRTVLRQLGAIEGDRFGPGRVTEVGTAFARAAVWTWP